MPLLNSRIKYSALSKEPLETDEDSFMRRFVTTQVAYKSCLVQ
jgi:hypothetical protein